MAMGFSTPCPFPFGALLMEPHIHCRTVLKKAAHGERLWDLCRSKTALNRWTSRAAQGGSRTDAAAGTGAGLHRREAIGLDSSLHGMLSIPRPYFRAKPNPRYVLI